MQFQFHGQDPPPTSQTGDFRQTTGSLDDVIGPVCYLAAFLTAQIKFSIEKQAIFQPGYALMSDIVLIIGLIPIQIKGTLVAPSRVQHRNGA